MKLRLSVLLFLLSVPVWAATYYPIHGWCESGGQTVQLQGLGSTTRSQGSYPGCTVTVYNTGTLTISTIYSDAMGSALGNPFTGDTNTGQWTFFVPAGLGVDIVLSGGTPPYSSPVTYTNVIAEGLATCVGCPTGSGTLNHLVKWLTASTQGDSIVTDDGSHAVTPGLKLTGFSDGCLQVGSQIVASNGLPCGTGSGTGGAFVGGNFIVSNPTSANIATCGSTTVIAASSTDPKYTDCTSTNQNGDSTTMAVVALVPTSGPSAAAVITAGILKDAQLFARVNQTATVRYWLGWMDVNYFTASHGTNGLYQNDDPAATTNTIAFRYSTNAGDTTWKCYASNGATSTVADSGVAIDTSTGHLFQVRQPAPGQLSYLIDGIPVCSILTNAPAAAAVLTVGISADNYGNGNQTLGFRYAYDFTLFHPGSSGVGIGLVAPNSNAVTVNANSASGQTLHTYQFAAGTLNTLGKTFHAKSTVNMTAVNTSETVFYQIFLNVGGSSGPGLPLTTQTPQTTSANGIMQFWDITCQTTTAGAAGVLSCYGTATVANNNPAAPAESAGRVLSWDYTGVDLTAAFTIGESVQFTTASTTNSATSKGFPIWLDN